MTRLSPVDDRPRAEESAPMLKRVRIRNYKSIAHCDVELGPFTLIVGRNGAGKSNFLDALRLVSEGLNGSPTWASEADYPWGGIADPGCLLEPVEAEPLVGPSWRG